MKKLDESMRSVTITPVSVVMTVAILLSFYFLFYIRQIVMMLFLALIVMSA
jgi:hypothetical protein